MRIARRLLVATALLVSVSGIAAARCGDDPGDAAAVAAARAQVATDCDCAGATSHAAHVRCAVGVAAQRVAATLLPAACQGDVRRCAARSTCGRAGFVTCCRTRSGVTRCRTKRSAARCTAPAGGSACVGAFTSCCDACTTGGCATTSTTSSTTTTTFPFIACIGGGPPSCGSGACDPGLSCQAALTAPNTLVCACLPDATGCGTPGVVFPTCAPGVCPGTTTCAAFQALDPGSGFTKNCLCVDPTVECLTGAGGACVQAGFCPAGQACSFTPISPGMSCPCCGCASPLP